MAESISIAIAAEDGPDAVSRCLASLPLAEGLDVHVACPRDRPVGVDASSAREHLIDGKPSRPALRAAAMRSATGQAVTVLNEDYTAPAGWLEAVRLTAEHQAEVVCGEVDPPADASLASRAAYLWEYSHLLPPRPAGPLDPEQARWIPAGCVVYRGQAREADRPADAASELEYHQAMAAAGIRFHRDPRLRVRYNPPPLAKFLRDRRRWSFEWARARLADSRPRSRWISAAGRLPLGPLLLARFAGRVVRRPRLWLTCLVGVPYFVAFAAAQVAGEVDACLAGADSE